MKGGITEKKIFEDVTEKIKFGADLADAVSNKFLDAEFFILLRPSFITGCKKDEQFNLTQG